MSLLMNDKLGSSGKALVSDESLSNVIEPSVLANRLKDKKIVFFTGAGFSMAWDASYPSGYKLFYIDDIEDVKQKYNFFKVAPLLEIKEPDPESNKYEEECLDFFKEIKFHLDIYRRYPSLIPSYLDKTIVNKLENEIRDFIKMRFQTLVGPSEFDISSTAKVNVKIKGIIQRLLKNNKSLSFITTNYDFIIEKILNDSDIHLVRGVIDLNAFRKTTLTREKKRVSLFKINGGFDVFKGNDGFYIDHAKSLTESPNIILPSQEQNYDDSYFKSVFMKAASKLRDADILIFVGYRLPPEDHTIRFLLKNFIDSDERENKEVFIVSRTKESALSEMYPNFRQLFHTLAIDDGVKVLDGDIESLGQFVK
ncbi:SIR2 family protein [Vibrio alginolyticus]|uniref:SIR2 family protein n=1 Tax=Vibrio alginolyticus TaxID=663 RepID=UPI002FF04A23